MFILDKFISNIYDERKYATSHTIYDNIKVVKCKEFFQEKTKFSQTMFFCQSYCDFSGDMLNLNKTYYLNMRLINIEG